MAIAKQIRDYSSGYPFLVSRICQILDEELVPSVFPTLTDAWAIRGEEEAVKRLFKEDNTLFQSLTAKLTNYPELKEVIRSILMSGARLTFNAQQEPIRQMAMYGFIKEAEGTVQISNRIFETLLYNLFLSDEELKSNAFYEEGSLGKNRFVENGVLNIRLILERFVDAFNKIYGPLEERFKEKDGRELFLLFLKPIINGTGNYYIEAQTRDQTRTDVIIDYLGKQYIIELKIWRGERYNQAGEQQLINYLEHFGLDTGYLLSFNFNKNKTIGIQKLSLNGKTLFEAMV